jgi:hypothetical protein
MCYKGWIAFVIVVVYDDTVSRAPPPARFRVCVRFEALRMARGLPVPAGRRLLSILLSVLSMYDDIWRWKHSLFFMYAL